MEPPAQRRRAATWKGTAVTTISFTVPGVPAPQGSKVRTKWGVREDNPATRPWRTSVAWEATAAMQEVDPLVGPLFLDVTFCFPRPKSHFGTGKNADVLKDNAPIYHVAKPDCDKLVRAIGDSLTGIVYRDDSQLAAVIAKKLYGSPRAVIKIHSLASPPPLA
jgi:Holliday junction resolvase RusA-like endonuclease